MKLQTQATPELSRLGELISDMPVAMMTTPGLDGLLASRPMTVLEMDEHGALWFFTDLRSTKLAQLQNVNLAFADCAKSSYVSLSGRGETDTDAAHIQKLWTPFAKPWFPDGPSSPNLALLCFRPSAAEFWDSSSSCMVRLFAMVASIVAGKPMALGVHDSYAGLDAASNVRNRTDKPAA